jgi:hypothetical protein
MRHAARRDSTSLESRLSPNSASDMAVSATLLLTCEAGTSIATPRGVRGARRRSQATAPSGMAPFCISALRHEPPGPQRTPRQGGVDGRATEGSAEHRGSPRRIGRNSRRGRHGDLRTGAEARRGDAARGGPGVGSGEGTQHRAPVHQRGVDWTSAYFFRGIKQETEDLILQPYGEVGVKLVDQAGALTALTLTGGVWNSLHTGPTGSTTATGSRSSAPSASPSRTEP